MNYELRIAKLLKIFIIYFMCTGCAVFMAFSLFMTPKIDPDNLKTNEELTKERQVYINKCQTCHSLINPKYKNKYEWTQKLQKYRDENIINDSETYSIIKYLEWAGK